MKEKYEVQYLNEDKESVDFGKWFSVPLEMCRHGLLCRKCQKDIKHLDVCDYTFDWTFSKQVALDKKQSLEEDGFKARIITTK